jgi:hypothetical protein
MRYPLLPGRTGSTSTRRVGPMVAAGVLLLALLMAGTTWSLVSSREPAILTTTMTTTPATAPVQLQATAQRTPADDAIRLRLAHAEQRLITAAEQLHSARRLLATLSPQLARVYLQGEKRRADAAWSACDAAVRALEQALDDVRLASATKE